MLEITCKLLVVQLLAEVTGISLAELLTQQLFVHRSIPCISHFIHSTGYSMREITPSEDYAL